MLRHLDLFSGIGGFSLAAKRASSMLPERSSGRAPARGGIQTTQFVEINTDAQLVLKHHFPGVPIHSDIRDYYPKPGEFEIITAKFPCTGTSNAGSRTGLQHPASSLWQDTQQKLAMSRQQSLARVIKGSDYLSFPTLTATEARNGAFAPSSPKETGEAKLRVSGCPPCGVYTSNAGSTSRPAGQNGRFKHLNLVQVSRPPKCDRWFKVNALVPNGYQLGTTPVKVSICTNEIFQYPTK